MRFYGDENLSADVAATARSLGVDMTSSHERGMDGAEDEEQLRHVGNEGRCIVTSDPDFVGLSRVAERGQWPHAGVLMLQKPLAKREYQAFARALVRFAEEHPDGLLPYEVRWFSTWEWQAD
jgi:predicted nuclease of predicted toxin-antitoxin system